MVLTRRALVVLVALALATSTLGCDEPTSCPACAGLQRIDEEVLAAARSEARRRCLSSVAAGADHTCAIVGDGRHSWCWGRNRRGEVGAGHRRVQPTPNRVADLAGVLGLALGWRHTCVIDAGHRLSCWGFNGTGQLGDGGLESHSLPVTVAGLDEVRAAGAGVGFNCALRSNGAVRCWGAADRGQLGDGTGYFPRWSPTETALFR